MWRPRAFILLFIVSLLVSGVVLMPAALVVQAVPELRVAGQPLRLAEPRGVWWQGQVQWRWQQLTGQLAWQWRWQGVTPGVQLTVQEKAKTLQASGWVGGYGALQAENVRAVLPVALIADQVPQGSADGRVELVLLSATIADGELADIQGMLDYSGGTVTWGRNGAATVPPLNGRIFTEDQVVSAQVTDPEGRLLATAQVQEQKLAVDVKRAWPMLLGVSQGGNPDDTVFQMSRPFRLGQ